MELTIGKTFYFPILVVRHNSNPNKERENNMYRLFINVNGQRNYVVNEKKSGNAYSFQLTTEQSAARKFKGGGSFSASPVAQFFDKEEVQTLVWRVKSNGNTIAQFSTEVEARNALVQYSRHYSCLSVDSIYV